MSNKYTNKQIAKALIALKPDAVWNLQGDDYSEIEWLDENIVKPTFTQIKSEIDNPTMSAEVQANAVARQAILDRLGLTADEAKLILG